MIDYLTGGNGFVGKNLNKRLNATLIPHSKLSTIKLEDFSRFFYLASYGNLIEHDDGPDGTAKVVKANVTDLCHILDQVVRLKFKSFVFMSTSSVKLRVQTTYSRCKKAAEEILLAYREKYHVQIIIVRPTTIYGLHEQPQHLIPTILRSCFKGEKMNFVKEPVHDYIFVEDVVDGLINLSENQAGGIFELGTGIQTSNQEILDIIENLTGKKANINIVSSMRSYDSRNWVSQNFRARAWGWLPKVNLKEGLKLVVEDYIKNPNNYDVR